LDVFQGLPDIPCPGTMRYGQQIFEINEIDTSNKIIVDGRIQEISATCFYNEETEYLINNEYSFLDGFSMEVIIGDFTIILNNN